MTFDENKFSSQSHDDEEEKSLRQNYDDDDDSWRVFVDEMKNIRRKFDVGVDYDNSTSRCQATRHSESNGRY